jgi:transcriptional regulator with XRE-family HTH domain
MPAVYIEPFYKRVGARIKAARVRAGLTQTELGEAVEPPMSRQHIANIENAQQRVMPHVLVQMAVALNEPIERLLEW